MRNTRKRFRVVVASDGSPQAQAAVVAAVHFPWPPNTEAMGVVARGGWHGRWSPSVALGLDAVVREVVVDTERALQRRWPDAPVTIADEAPIDAIVKRARGAGVVVLGAHGYSKFERWVLGSVSRAVVRRATTAVLVVKARSRTFRNLIVGYDGSPHARRALDLVAAFTVPRRGRVTLLAIVQSVHPPTMGLLPARIQAVLAAEARAATAERVAKARRDLERVARPLQRAGWQVRFDVRPGVPQRDLVTVPAALGGDLLVIGAQGAGALRRILLGSVAETVVDRAPLSTLLVR